MSLGPVPAEHRDEAEQLARQLRAAGWASHATVDRLLSSWEQLAAEADRYSATIDDYTNDVTSRDALDLVVAWASVMFAAYLRQRLGQADERFKDSTVEDGGAAVGKYFRIDLRDGWWWRRRPCAGPLSDYLDGR